MKACSFSPGSRYLTVQNMLDELNMVVLEVKTVVPPRPVEPPTTKEPPVDIPGNDSDDGLTNTVGSSSAGTGDDTPTQYGGSNHHHEPPKKPTKQPATEPPRKPRREPVKNPPVDTNKPGVISKAFKILLNVGLVGIALFLIVLIICSVESQRKLMRLIYLVLIEQIKE